MVIIILFYLDQEIEAISAKSLAAKRRSGIEPRMLTLALALSAPVPRKGTGFLEVSMLSHRGIIQGDQKGSQVLMFLRGGPAWRLLGSGCFSTSTQILIFRSDPLFLLSGKSGVTFFLLVPASLSFPLGWWKEGALTLQAETSSQFPTVELV